NLRNVSLYRQVDKDLKTEIINFDFDKDNDRVINSLDIKAKENTKSSFLLTYNSKDVDCYLNSLIRVHLGKNSKVKLVIVVNLENKSHNYQQIASIIEEDANLEISYIELGSSKSFVNFKNFLDGKRSQLHFDGVYFKENEDYLD